MRSDSINQNLQIEEQLSGINEKIREIERSYFKSEEDIKYAE